MKLYNRVRKKGYASTILKGSSFSFFINIFNLIVAFILQLVLARILGVESFGYYSFATTLLAFLILPSKLGLDIVTTRYVSAYKSKDEYGMEKGVIKSTNNIVLCASIIILCIAMVVILNLKSIDDEFKMTLLLSLLCVPFMALTVLRQSALQAYRLILYAQLPEKVIRPILMILFSLFSYFVFKDILTSIFAIILFLLCNIIAFIIGAYFLNKKVTKNLKHISPEYRIKEWIHVAIPLMFVSAMYLLLGQLDVLMLGMLDSTDSSGVYSVSLKIASVVSFGILAVNTIAAPMISEAFAQKDIYKLKRISNFSSLLGSVVALISITILFLFSNIILGFFGEDFKDGAVPVILLAVSNLINALAGQTGTIMNMTGQQGSLGIVLFVTVILNFILNLFLIPLYGMLGAGIATVLSTFVWNISMIILVKIKHGFNPSIFGLLSKK
ncbi:flippase [Oceanobacillus sojae]|uniref:flippase n=1 Tax=Oceanobacillus sojae TaxID=582851 RepID=UPI0021A85059|nr:flippase [Oceanobacillus sojae]MCT1901860.1 flippase [Oceanobacillus sojae]